MVQRARSTTSCQTGTLCWHETESGTQDPPDCYREWFADDAVTAALSQWPICALAANQAALAHLSTSAPYLERNPCIRTTPSWQRSAPNLDPSETSREAPLFALAYRACNEDWRS